MSIDTVHDVYINHAINVLNRALNKDPIAINAIMEHRFSCNKDLVDDPTIQVMDNGDTYLVGTLGLINGIFGIRENGHGYIAAVYDVVCETHGVVDGKIGDRCSVEIGDTYSVEKCDRILELGPLIKFERTDK